MELSFVETLVDGAGAEQLGMRADGFDAAVIDDHNASPYDSLKSKVKEIAAQILAARAQLIDDMLSPWA